MPLLEVVDCTKKFGGLLAVKGLNLSLEKGELVGLIGPNGAGKTTAFNLLTGVYSPTSGSIKFAGTSTAGAKPSQIARLGISRTFQNIRLFHGMSVEDNIKAATHIHFSPSVASSILRTEKWSAAEASSSKLARELLDRFGLSSVAHDLAKNLAYGQQRRLEIARALATRPKLLLLDEPAAGMNPQEKQDLMAQIHAIREDFDLTILLIEHDMKVVMGVCERLIVLDYGEIISTGSPEMVRSDPRVIEAYLGSILVEAN